MRFNARKCYLQNLTVIIIVSSSSISIIVIVIMDMLESVEWKSYMWNKNGRAEIISAVGREHMKFIMLFNLLDACLNFL